MYIRKHSTPCTGALQLRIIAIYHLCALVPNWTSRSRPSAQLLCLHSTFELFYWNVCNAGHMQETVRQHLSVKCTSTQDILRGASVTSSSETDRGACICRLEKIRLSWVIACTTRIACYWTTCDLPDQDRKSLGSFPEHNA